MRPSPPRQTWLLRALARFWHLHRPLIVQEWRHQPLRQIVCTVVVALGVALALSVHGIHEAALSEFAAASRASQGEADVRLTGPTGTLDDAWADRVHDLPGVADSAPWLSWETTVRRAGTTAAVPVQVIGLDGLKAHGFTPAWRPVAGRADESPWGLLEPDRIFANPGLMRQLGLQMGERVQIRQGDGWVDAEVAGSVAAGGPSALVMDIAAAQNRFDRVGQLSRLDLRLSPGQSPEVWARDLPSELVIQDDKPGGSDSPMAQMSQAYRVNLTVLSLVALLVGAFLVYSVMTLSATERSPRWAFLGVLGMTAAERRTLVLLEAGIIGGLGSGIGVALGWGLTALGVHTLSGDLGSGLMRGVAPQWSVSPWASAFFGALGLVCALLGAWLPARQIEQLPIAQALKGLGPAVQRAQRRWQQALPWVMLGGAAALATLPAWNGLPIAAYASVAIGLVAAVAAIPQGVAGVRHLVRRPDSALGLLAWERASAHAQAATAAMAGVVASLALCVALTVMVSSFRQGVADWLDRVLPADLYLRTAGSTLHSESAWLAPEVADLLAQAPGVRQVQRTRVRALLVSRERPAVSLIARDPSSAGGTLADDLPVLQTATKPADPQRVSLWVSEAVVALHSVNVGDAWRLQLEGQSINGEIRGVFRDYARQFGAVAMDRRDYLRLTGDAHITEMAVWLHEAQRSDPGALARVKASVDAQLADPTLLEWASTQELRELSLRIFDRSFAVTRYLQVVALLIGLVGVGASLSAQILARRKEFGLLRHLGLTRPQVHALVVFETGLWLLAGALWGTCLGALISLVLVHVVNPQSFHWTMAWIWPSASVAGLALAMVSAGLVTAWWSARHAATRSAVLAVKEDW